MQALVGHTGTLVWVAAKAALLFFTAVVALRLAPRRTLGEMTAIDFIAAVAVGAIVGRVPNASDASYLSGVVTLLTVLAAHAVLTHARQWPSMAAMLDHPPRLLVVNGSVQHRQLRRCGLTTTDLFSLLRQRGVFDLSTIAYVVYEQRGRLSVVPSAALHHADTAMLEPLIDPTATAAATRDEPRQG